MNEIGSFFHENFIKRRRSKISPDWLNADSAKFPEIEDYFKALNEGVALYKEQELYIRKQIWWAYNDRIREGKNPFVDANDEIRWRENCVKLMSLLDFNNINQRLMIAELKRNLGDFEGSLEILQTINDPRFEVMKNKIIQECEKQNKRVIKII
ncbi:MAG: hypothetical protein N2747_08315 [Chitinophagaceae bacterium]|nr:hypothetical protein [Chitinophagaceae bacterium]